MGLVNSIVDFKEELVKNTEFIEKYNQIISMINDEEINDAVELFYVVLNIYLDTYKCNKDIILENFRNDSKIVFELMYKLFVSDEVKREIESDLLKEPDNEILISEYNEYIEFIDNINYIKANVENITLDGDDNILSSRCKNCVLFLKKKEEGLNELNNSISNLNNHLKEAMEKLQSFEISNNVD
jgi:hypothetical protein